MATITKLQLDIKALSVKLATLKKELNASVKGLKKEAAEFQKIFKQNMRDTKKQTSSLSSALKIKPKTAIKAIAKKKRKVTSKAKKMDAHIS